MNRETLKTANISHDHPKDSSNNSSRAHERSEKLIARQLQRFAGLPYKKLISGKMLMWVWQKGNNRRCETADKGFMREDLLLQVSNLCLMATNLYLAHAERNFVLLINFLF